jgi:hypothetical protein
MSGLLRVKTCNDGVLVEQVAELVCYTRRCQQLARQVAPRPLGHPLHIGVNLHREGTPVSTHQQTCLQS